MTKVGYASEVFDPSGSGTVATLPADTVIESSGPFATELGGNVLEIAGITDTDGGLAARPNQIAVRCPSTFG